jgi:hypothetical protein
VVALTEVGEGLFSPGAAWRTSFSCWARRLHAVMRVGGASVTLPLPPKPDRQISRIRLSSSWLPMGWLRFRRPGVQRPSTSRASLRSTHPFPDGPLASDSLSPGDSPSHRRVEPSGTTSALVRGVHSGGDHHVPTSLGSTVVTRFPATTDALTPAGPFVAPHRGSLIHVSLTSDHAVSNHLRCSHSRDPLPLRCGLYFVRASLLSSQARQHHRPNRVHSVAVQPPRRYGLVVLVPMLSTRGYGPDAVSFRYWPYSVGQVRDFHPAVNERFQAHELVALRRVAPRRAAQRPSGPAHPVRSTRTGLSQRGKHHL